MLVFTQFFRPFKSNFLHPKSNLNFFRGPRIVRIQLLSTVTDLEVFVINTKIAKITQFVTVYPQIRANLVKYF